MSKLYTKSVNPAPTCAFVAQQEQPMVSEPKPASSRQMGVILRVKELARYLSVSRSSIYNLMDAKSKYYKADFPKPISLKSEVDAYLERESKKANTPETQNQ